MRQPAGRCVAIRAWGARLRAVGSARGRGARPGRRGWLVAIALLAVTPAGADSAAFGAELGVALEAPALRGARVAVLVQDADTGARVFARSPDEALIPASNQKLVTALAALGHFGPSHRFETSIHSDAPPDREGRVAWLAVRGSGDPTLTSEQWWRLAADLRRRGLRRVEGGIRLDDSRFDRIRWHPSWGPTGARAYHAPVSALSANYGALALEISPAPDGAGRPGVRVDPPVAYLRIDNQAVTASPGSRVALVIERRPSKGFETFRVSGRIPADSAGEVFYRSVADPTLYAGAVFRLQLEANGIEVAGLPTLASVPSGAHELLRFEGKAMAEIVWLLQKFSSNLIAESLVKALGADQFGAPGSWPRGMRAVQAALAAQGLAVEAAVLRDGSGLSRGNRVPPALLVETLTRARRSFELGPEWMAALPIASRDGTLAERLDGAASAVRAKTGLLDRVVALSGYLQTRAGRTLAFSVLVNDARVPEAQVMAAVDAFVERLRDAPGR